MIAISGILRRFRHDRTLVLLLLIIALGLILRIYDLGAESIWYDEAYSIYESTLSLKEIANYSNHPPLYFLILNWWIRLWGTSETAVRSLSVLFGVFAIIATFFVGKELFNDKVGLLGSFISAISQFYIHYSQDTRDYSLLLLLSLLSYLFFIKIIKRDKTWYFSCYFLATLLLGYTHVYGIFIIISQLLYACIIWGRFKELYTKLLPTWIATIAGLSPLIILLGPKAMTIAQSGFWIPQPTLRSIAGSLFEYSSGFWIGVFPQSNVLMSSTFLQDGTAMSSTELILLTIVKFVLLALFGALAAIGIFSVWQRRNKKTIKQSALTLKTITLGFKKENVEKVLMLLLWLFIPLGLPFVASQIVTPIYWTRYTIGASPALYLLVAQGLSMLSRKGLYTSLIIIAIFTSYCLYGYYSVDLKEQWREAALLVQNESRDNDIIVFSNPLTQLPFDYYYKDGLDEFSASNGSDVQEVAMFIEDISHGKDRLWLIVSHENSPPPVYDYLKDKYMIIKWTGFRRIVVFLFDLNDSLVTSVYQCR